METITRDLRSTSLHSMSFSNLKMPNETFFVSRNTWETIHSLVPLATRFFVSRDTWETMHSLITLTDSLGDEVLREPRHLGNNALTSSLGDEVLREPRHLGNNALTDYTH